jgi:hypothetical protein
MAQHSIKVTQIRGYLQYGERNDASIVLDKKPPPGARMVSVVPLMFPGELNTIWETPSPQRRKLRHRRGTY